MRKISLELLRNLVGYSIGSSGAGKGVFQEKALAPIFEKKDIKLVSRQSGECYRASAKADPDFKKKMDEGNFAKTLGPVMPDLKKTIREFVISLIEGKSSFLVLDGFLRVPEFVLDGEVIPSQIEQVATAWFGVLGELAADEKYAGSFDPELSNFLKLDIRDSYHKDGINDLSYSVEGTVLSKMSNFVKGSHIFVVDVTEANAEALMRVRVSGALEKFTTMLKEESNDGKVLLLAELLTDLKCLEEGRFTYSYPKGPNGKRTKTITIDRGKEANLFRKLTKFDKSAFDREVKRSARDIHELAGKVDERSNDEKKIIDSVADILKESNFVHSGGLSINELTEPIRGDDISLAARLNRGGEYKKKVVPMLINEMGFEYLSEEECLKRFGFTSPEGHGILSSKKENVLVLPNGPEMGVTLEQYKRNGTKEGVLMIDAIENALLIDSLPTKIEGQRPRFERLI